MSDFFQILKNRYKCVKCVKIPKRKSDVMIGGLYENQVSRKILSSSIPFYQDDITWCVAKAGLAPKWMNVFIIFNCKWDVYPFMFSLFITTFAQLPHG